MFQLDRSISKCLRGLKPRIAAQLFGSGVLIFGLPLGLGVPPGLSREMAGEFLREGSSSELERQARQLYESGRFEEAISLLQNLSATAAENGNSIEQAIALRNLALVYRETGNLDAARNSVTQALELLEPANSTAQTRRVLAECLEVSGSLQLDMGESETAIETWKQAKQIYQTLDDLSGLTRSQISIAQGLKSLGLYRQAIDLLQAQKDRLQSEPDTLLKARVLHSLGDAFRAIANVKEAQTVLEQSLQIAQQQGAPEEIARISIALGNTVRLQSDRLEAAIDYYQQAIASTVSPQSQTSAQLNLLSLSIESGKTEDAQSLVPQIEENLSKLSVNKYSIYAKINLAKSLIKLNSSSRDGDRQAAELLATSVRDAKVLGDRRTESYALGNLGKLYEQRQQWDGAKQLTEQALLLAQSTNATDIAYQWQWQLGRILTIQNNREGAIAAYSQAIDSLKAIRSDLVAIGDDVQFSFRKSVEPVYREFVSLLLQPGVEVTQQDLTIARQTIESLQLAELDNYFRDACLDAQPAQIDKVDNTAAVLYPIILNDRLETIAAIPGKPLKHYTTFQSKSVVESTISEALTALSSRRKRENVNNFLQPSQKLYDWLIRPIESELSTTSVGTLVFVLDGLLRRLPMSSLHDGSQYVIQNYAVALVPGLQLVNSQPIAATQFQVFTAGLSEARQGFEALPGVENELLKIRSEVIAQGVFNQTFTEENVQNLLDSSSFPIVHLATHGEFSSNLEDTFILTWDDRINANELERFLKSRTDKGEEIELLVLSACKTAAGDDRAALGLAGVAVRAGARSTLASLWSVSDEATSMLMSQLYIELAKRTESKAEALRLAQEAVLENEELSHPYFWSAFVLVGNWL